MELARQMPYALAQLAKAHAYACATAAELWQFAVEIDELTALGLTKTDLRWLALSGYVDHACEVTRSEDTTRRFQPRPSLAFTERTCFILTDAGLSLVRAEQPGPEILRLPDDSAATPTAGPSVPRWDRERRTLYVGERIVKQYRQPSANQQAVLAAFEEEGWPYRIDDPLPPRAEQDPKYRLHHTIHRLNSHQQHHLIRFTGDGTGEAVCWQWTRSVSLASSAGPAPKKIRLAA